MYAIKYKNALGNVSWMEVETKQEAAVVLGIHVEPNIKKNGHGWVVYCRDCSVAFYTDEWTQEEVWRDYCSDLFKRKMTLGILAVYKEM